MKYIIGVGNYAMGDDGIGLQLIESLATTKLPPDCHLLELKNDALGLFSYLVPETSAILIVDCVKMGVEPGEWRLFTPEEVRSIKRVANSTTHEGDLLQIIQLARVTGYTIPPLRILGIQPGSIEPSMELSTTVRERLPEYVDVARQLIAEEW
jgi:hydrogenase maturation protease